jgi:hypothetical protein
MAKNKLPKVFYPAGEPMQGKWVLQLQKKNMPAPEFRYFERKKIT